MKLGSLCKTPRSVAAGSNGRCTVNITENGSRSLMAGLCLYILAVVSHYSLMWPHPSLSLSRPKPWVTQAHCELE